MGKRVGERAYERGEGEGLDRKEDLAEKVLPLSYNSDLTKLSNGRY